MIKLKKPIRYATCNSCAHFKAAELGNWNGFTPLCTKCPTCIGHDPKTGYGIYKPNSGKTVTWIFNCMAACDCPNYAGLLEEEYLERVRAGELKCRNGSNFKENIVSDMDFLASVEGIKYLINNGWKPIKQSIKQLSLEPTAEKPEPITYTGYIIVSTVDGKIKYYSKDYVGCWVDSPFAAKTYKTTKMPEQLIIRNQSVCKKGWKDAHLMKMIFRIEDISEE